MGRIGVYAPNRLLEQTRNRKSLACAHITNDHSHTRIWQFQHVAESLIGGEVGGDVIRHAECDPHLFTLRDGQTELFIQSPAAHGQSWIPKCSDEFVSYRLSQTFRERVETLHVMPLGIVGNGLNQGACRLICLTGFEFECQQSAPGSNARVDLVDYGLRCFNADQPYNEVCLFDCSQVGVRHVL